MTAKASVFAGSNNGQAHFEGFDLGSGGFGWCTVDAQMLELLVNSLSRVRDTLQCRLDANRSSYLGLDRVPAQNLVLSRVLVWVAEVVG